jgi:hypothetical protein
VLASAWWYLSALILLALFQRLPNDLVLIGASEMPQEAFRDLIVNERGKRSSFCAARGVQLDYMVTVINASLEGWRISHVLRDVN